MDARDAGLGDALEVVAELHRVLAAAHEAGKEGLTLQVDQEMEQCGLTDPANLDDIEAEIEQLRAEYEAENAG